MSRTWRVFATAAVALMLCGALPPASLGDSITVRLSVDASESFDNPLKYRWRATDGQIVDPTSPTTDWTLPNGPGIHFAYVLVSNDKGGYTEGRIAVNTDGNPTTTMLPRDQYTTMDQAVSVPSPPQTGMTQIKGTLLLDDSSKCATRNPFFGVNVNATVQFADNGGKLLGEPLVLDPYAYGQFVIDDNTSGSSLVFTCERATLTVTRNFFNMKFFTIHGTAQPEVKSMSATLNGIGIFPVPPVVPLGILQSDFLAGRESDKSIGPPPQFLAFRGLDTRLGSCQYYKSVGAVEKCDDFGNYQGKTLTFDAWREAAHIDGSLHEEVQAIFVNKTDLNLTRDHHSVQFQIQNTTATAAYVCNHPGPAADPNTDPTGLFPSLAAIDAAIDAVVLVDPLHPQGRNLIACVAMDRVPITAESGLSVTGQPVTGPDGEMFVRFLIFGPNGDLLPSVNLDGNGEKFAPGACVACHGGTGYFALTGSSIFGGFPETDIANGADLKSYFLPYDVDNFEFHSKRRFLIKEDQQASLWGLNLYAKQVNDKIAMTNKNMAQMVAFDELFNGWYPRPFMFQSTWVPKKVYTTSESQSFYLNVVARSCRTCHIAMDTFNFERLDPVGLVSDLVCGQPLAAFIHDGSVDPEGSASSYLMPNSRVTFDRFWLSGQPSIVGQPASTVDQPGALRDHYSQTHGGQQLPCVQPH